MLKWLFAPETQAFHTVTGRDVAATHRHHAPASGPPARLTNPWLVSAPGSSHLLSMMKNAKPRNTRRPLALLLAAALALGACAGTTGGGGTELELPRFDRELQDTIGGA